MAHPRNTLSDQCPRVELGRKSYTEPAIEEVYNDRQKGCLTFRPDMTRRAEHRMMWQKALHIVNQT